VNGLDPIVENAGRSIGLLGSDGSLSSAWFQNPLEELKGVLTDPGQRTALLSLIDRLWKPEPIPGAPATEKWHPLLGNQPSGNLYLTVDEGPVAVTVGVAADFHSTTSPLPASLRAHLPLIRAADDGVTGISGTDAGPFDAEVRVELNWSRAGGQDIDLRAIAARAVLAPLASVPARLHISLEGLSVDGSPARDVELDPGDLNSEAFSLVVGLLRERLRQVAAGGAVGEAGALAVHLMPLLGLADGFPTFPFATLISDPTAFRTWLAALIESTKITDWLGHFGAIFGGAATAAGSGAPADPWRVRIFAIDANSDLNLTLIQSTEEHSGSRRLDVGLQALYLPAGPHPSARIDAAATIASIPFDGPTTPAVLPTAALLVVAPGIDADQLVASPVIAARSLRAGVRWNGSAIVPQLELNDVTLTLVGQSHHYDRIDLTHADSVVGVASDAVADAVRSALGVAGGGAGAHLAALAGLVPPAGDAASPHLVDVPTLVSNPTQAIAAVHRAALIDGVHGWSFLFDELAALAGLSGRVGAGTKADPWRVPLASGGIDLEVAAWNQQESGSATDPQQLRIGLRASAGSAPWSFWWLAEVLAFDLPQQGSASVALMSGQHAAFVLQPAPAVPELAGVSITADSFSVLMDWSLGGAMRLRAAVENVAVAADGATTTIPSLVFPPPAGFDVNNPAASLGVSLVDLETLFRLLFSRALFAWAGPQGLALSALLGLNRHLPGLQSDWPIVDANFFADPFGSLRAWLAHLVADVSADGTPFLPNGLAWLAGFLNGRLPAALDAAAPEAIAGAGRYDDPWIAPLTADIDVLGWLEPDGLPASWAAALPAAIAAAASFSELLDAAVRLSPFVPGVREALTENDRALLSDALETLSAWLKATDGFVPLSSQLPTGGAWTAGALLDSAHPAQPSDPQAIAQVNAQIAAWNPGARAVLLLGPAFSDHTIWNDLLAPVALKPNFNLRLSGVDPLTVDLRAVSDAADFFTADLQENGIVGVAAQIGRVVARINELRPGVPVTLVAHSTAGLAARAFTAANPPQVRGLITIGTPHEGSPLFPLKDVDGGTALRFQDELAPDLPAGPIRDALDALVRAADGWLPAPAAGELPIAAPFPVGAFAAPGSTDTGGVPALALGGRLAGDLLDHIKQALGSLAVSAASAVTPPPTHLAFGVRAHVDFGASGAVSVDTFVRGDAFRIALRPGVLEPARAARAMTVGITLTRIDDWLAGSPTSDVRVRWAELGLFESAGVIAPYARLHDSAFHSPSLGLVDLANPQGQTLLGAVFHEIASPPPTAGTALNRLLAALDALAVTATDSAQGVGISADALSALTADPAGFLAQRVRSALDRGLAGFMTSAGTGSTLPFVTTPFELYVDGPTIGLRTSGAWPLGPIGSATIDARLSLPALTPALDLSMTLGAVTLAYSQASGTVTLTAPPWIDSLTLFPTAAGLPAALNRAVPRLLLSSASSALIEASIGPGLSVAAIDAFLEAPGVHARSSSSFGNGSSLDASKITALLQTIAAAAGMPPGQGLSLPGNIQVTASGVDDVTLQFGTTAPIGGVCSFDLSARIDGAFHVSPAGAISLRVPLPSGLAWTAVTLTFGVAESGISLAFAPDAAPPIAPIQLLPNFSGLGALAGAADSLLPSALDALVNALGPSPFLDASLAVAQAFDLYDAATKFSGHAGQLKTLTHGDWTSTVEAGMRGAAIPAIQSLLSLVNATATSSGSRVAIGSTGMFRVALGWDPTPTVSLQAAGLKAADGALSADVTTGYVAGAIVVSATIGVHLQSSIGLTIVPQIAIAYTAGKFSIKLLPLGGAQESVLAVVLAPAVSVNTSPDTASALARQWLLPIAADLVVNAARPQLTRTVWVGGPTVEDLLTGSGLLVGGNLASPLPEIKAIVTGVLVRLAAATTIGIGDLKVTFVSDATGLGVNLRGLQRIPLDSLDLTLHFDNLDIPAPEPGVTVYVFRNLADFTVDPKLAVHGLGVDLTGPGGRPLIKEGSFRLEGVGGYLFFEFDGALSNLGAALEAKQVGLPLGLLGGPHDGGNPVASSLVEGAGSNNGDPSAVNPAVNVLVYYVNGDFAVEIGNPNPPLWLGVHRSFGPIYIEQIGVEWTDTAADLLVDGSVRVGPLTVQAYELGLEIPFRELLAPDHWSLDLKGLAVGFESGSVSIAGGLARNPGPPVEYDGVLSCDIAGRGFTVVGGYARPSDSAGSYTSLFIFVSLPIPLGGPPFLFVTGLGGGAGYNRELKPPTDFNQIPGFFLVEAIDDDSLANDPMGALVSMASSVPPRRGSFWLAAGVRFNSFVVVNTVAVVYVSLDRGLEVGLLGVSRMQLPADGIELVNIELALKARFSAAEALLSIQAQLTDNSWLFSPDCQLTGGFAFFIWFPEGHFVLTMGGYHPALQRPPEFPVVPRLGFHWQVLGFVQIKGEAYFAITSSSFMCGGRMDASASFSGIRAWFTIHADILIQWDPFHYDFEVGVEVGVSLKIEVCFFGACAHVSITISKGADVHIFGPPFHIELTFDAYVTSITLSFGGDPQPRPDPLLWEPFRDKYLVSGNPEGAWVSVRVVQGLLAPEPPGAQPAAGRQTDPWRLNPEFAFLSESRMPVSGYSAGGTFDSTGAVIQLPFKSLGDSQVYDLAPMDKLKVGSNHTIRFMPPVTHPEQFLVEEVHDLLPEATWRWHDPAHLAASAARIRSISGLRITAFAVLRGKSAQVPISTLVDDDPRYALPLPFATVTGQAGALKTHGLTAEALAAITAGADSGGAIRAAAIILAGTGFFSSARRSSGLPPAGMPPLALDTLRRGRSSPPLITPLTSGLSMKPVALPVPPPFLKTGSTPHVLLDQPRLRAVMQSRPQAVVDAPSSVRTTVRKVSARGVVRMAPPRPKVVAGSRLDRIHAANAPRPSAAAIAPRTLRNAELGAPTGIGHAANFEAAAKNLTGDGVTIAAGATHVWEVAASAPQFVLVGTAAVRITSMNRAGHVIDDTEMIVRGETRFAASSGCECVALTCLGIPALPAGAAIKSGFGAVSWLFASACALPAVGWQTGNTLPQVGASSLLGRGAALLLRKAHVAVTNGRRTTQLMTRVSDALAGQSGVETWLPTMTTVVMILLDQQDARAADDGDLSIACDGATLSTPPVAGAGGSRRALLYDVTADGKAPHIAISVASRSGWALAGVIGLPGKAAEWAARLHGSVPPHLIPDGPLTTAGEVRVRLAASHGGNS
jgi:hypothetical protein